MRTVLHVLATAEREAVGIARIAIAAARAAASGGYRSRAVFMAGEGPLLGRLRAAGVPADVVYWGRARNVAGNIRAWRYLRHVAPDIVHQHFGSEYLRGLIRAAGVPRIVAHFHDHGSEVEHGRTVPHSARFADAVIATSHSVAKLVRGRVEPQVIYPAVVPVVDRPPVPLDRRAPVIGALSRLAPVKGYIYLVHAMPAVLARLPQARLEIAGEGPDAPLLEAEAKRLGIAHAVTLLGWRDDLDAVFAGWRVFAAPSLMEGFGLSILEAAMRGLPIVASGVGGIPELIEDHASGVLVPPAEPAALASALADCLLDMPRAARLGEHAALRARSLFAPAAFDAAIRRIYDGL
jgi:glycosyltransferase involved in cell wall biosynthesis